MRKVRLVQHYKIIVMMLFVIALHLSRKYSGLAGKNVVGRVNGNTNISCLAKSQEYSVVLHYLL